MQYGWQSDSVPKWALFGILDFTVAETGADPILGPNRDYVYPFSLYSSV